MHRVLCSVDIGHLPANVEARVNDAAPRQQAFFSQSVQERQGPSRLRLNALPGPARKPRAATGPLHCLARTELRRVELSDSQECRKDSTTSHALEIAASAFPSSRTWQSGFGILRELKCRRRWREVRTWAGLCWTYIKVCRKDHLRPFGEVVANRPVTGRI